MSEWLGGLSEENQRSAEHNEKMATIDGGLGPRRADGTPVRVLVVDDEPDLLDVVSRMLRSEGWAVATAATGGEALARTREFRPDAVVLDIMLPDRDGLQ